MKKIRIKICNFSLKDPFYSYGHFIIKALSKYYEVELSEDPQYVFYHESTYEQLKYGGIKIFYTGENIHPNFNLCDYAFTFDYMDFGDRHFRLPLYLVVVFCSTEETALAGDTDFKKPYPFTKEDLRKKTGFCSFVYSNYLVDQTRKIFFDKLSAYKKVDAGGKYLNNTGFRVPNKLEFEMKHKFSIAFENSSRDGYTTEKLLNSLAARTIPIYFGNPRIHEEFNEKRFINCHRYKNFEEVIERVKEIDANDDLYLEIINEPVTVKGYNFKKVREEFELFLKNIVDQPLSKARRIRINPARAADIRRNELIAARYGEAQNAIKKMLAALYQPFKKLGFLEGLKQKYFRRKMNK